MEVNFKSVWSKPKQNKSWNKNGTERKDKRKMDTYEIVVYELKRGEKNKCLAGYSNDKSGLVSGNFCSPFVYSIRDTLRYGCANKIQTEQQQNQSRKTKITNV